MKANLAVDVQWIKENGYNIQDPFVIDVFKYAIDTAEKYEKLRQSPVFKLFRKVKRYV